MSEEYILKHMKIKSFNKIKLDQIDPFLEKHETKLQKIDPSVKDWKKYIKKIRNIAIKENKSKKDKSKKEIEPTTPREKPPFYKGEDPRIKDTRSTNTTSDKDEILTKLERDIVKKAKVKEWTSL